MVLGLKRIYFALYLPFVLLSTNVACAQSQTQTSVQKIREQSGNLYTIIGDIATAIYELFFPYVVAFLVFWACWELIFTEKERVKSAAMPLGLLFVFFVLPYLLSTLLNILEHLL